MKKKLLKYNLAVLMLVISGLSHADNLINPNELKIGTWIFSFYKADGKNQETSSLSVCGGGTGWSQSGPLIYNVSANGGFSYQDKNIYIYGKLHNGSLPIFPLNNSGTVRSNTSHSGETNILLSAFGVLIEPDLVTGTYQKINLHDLVPKGDYGTFKAVYAGEECAL